MGSTEAQAVISATQKLQILSSQVDEQNEGLNRILDGLHVRYVRIRLGTFEEETICWPHLLLPALPSFPRGSWKSMEISRRNDGTLSMETNSDALEAVEVIWHPIQIDIFTLPTGKRLKISVRETIYRDRLAILKFASFPWEIHRIEWETWAYHQIESKASPDDPPLAPSFLGHVEENGRVIGFLLERIEGNHATIADLELCKSGIRRLHELGIRHGDPCRYNFLIDAKRSIVRMVDFENARPLSNLEDPTAQEELENLQEELKDTSDRGAGLQELRP